MDYTKIPEPLIYQRRKNLHEFIDSNSLIAKLVENMVEIDYLNQYDFESSALNALNTACYICTIIMLDQNPEWRWAFFLRQAANSQNSTIDTDDDAEFVMALVYVFLRRCSEDWRSAHQAIMKKVFSYNYHNYRYFDADGELRSLDTRHKIIRHLIRQISAEELPDDFFAPCAIDARAINETEIDMGQMNMGWQELTNDYNSQAINELMEAVCKNDEERALLAEAIIDEADKMQMGYRVDFLRQPLPPTTNNTTESPSEAAQLLTRIKELDVENVRLKQESAQQAAPDEASKIEKLCAQLLAAQDRIKELENEVREQRKFKQELEELSNMSAEGKLAIDERIIFFSSAVGLDFDPKRTNQTQLAKLISELSGDAPTSIRGRISKMNQMEKENNFTDEVMQAARNVKGMLEKVPQGNQPQKLKDIIENIEAVFLN